jgi:hypothetical protein
MFSAAATAPLAPARASKPSPSIEALTERTGSRCVTFSCADLRCWLSDAGRALREAARREELAAKTEKMPLRRWVCWEWMFDAGANALQLWIDTAPQTEIDIANRAVGGCVAGGPRIWQGPQAFTKMIIGWEQYTTPSEVPQEAWIDDLMVGDQRIGCPSPGP